MTHHQHSPPSLPLLFPYGIGLQLITITPRRHHRHLRSDEACEAAYFKMNNAVIDDRRVRVDFSQSVHHLWKQFRK